MAEENRNSSAPAGEGTFFSGGVDSILAAVCEEMGLANRIYDLAVQMEKELGGVTGEPENDTAAAARLVQMEHEARQTLHRAVKTETRLMEQLADTPEEPPASPREEPPQEEPPQGDARQPETLAEETPPAEEPPAPEPS